MRKQRFFSDAMWPPTMEQVKTYFFSKGMNEQEAEHFFLLNQLRGWRTQKGEMMRKWKKAAHWWIWSATHATA